MDQYRPSDRMQDMVPGVMDGDGTGNFSSSSTASTTVSLERGGVGGRERDAR